jgi:hypothetical protein
MAFGATDYQDANDPGVGWGPIGWENPNYSDPYDVPSGVYQNGAYPNTGPTPTYPGQGGLQVGGTLNVQIPGGGGVSVTGGTGAQPYPPMYNRTSYGSSFLGGNTLLLIIIAVGVIVILR